ncbi:retrovirus-related pol polyprotein from transposon TNT 1-94 [Tanacetum coccineum]
MSNSNTSLQTQSSNALHNAIMEAGSKDRPPMLAPGNYVQWKSRIKRYIDTKPNSELIHYCLQNPPYTYQWAEKTVPVAEGSSETTTERYMENYKNVSQDIQDQLNVEAEAVQIILTGIDNDIYSTVDACPNACEMWKTIERLKQDVGLSLSKSVSCYKSSSECPVLTSTTTRMAKRKLGYDIRGQLMLAGIRENVDSVDNSGPFFDDDPRHKVEIDCAKAKGDLMSYKIDFEKSSNAYTQKINDLNQTISDMKKELCAHQETISIMSQAKEAQIKLYKTREDKELDKVIALENKVKVLNDIVYKTGQTVQTMNMLNRNCKTSFAKPEFLKKAQRANPRLYDIGCYNDNLALMLAPDSDETIRLEKERRSKLSDLIRPFDYDQLNKLYDLFVPQREKSPGQHYFPKTSKMSHTSSNKEFSKESFRKQTTLLEKRMDESIPWDQKCKSSKELFKIKKSVDTIFDGVERCKQTIAKRTYFGVIPNTSVSRPQLKSNHLEDRVMSNNSQGKKQEVEDHRRKFKFSNNKTSVTACNDSLNAKTSNVNFVCVTCGKCVLNDNHDLCVLHYINGVNSRTRQPMAVPVRTTEPKHDVNKSVATSSKKTVATDSTVKKSRNITRKLYEQVSKTCSWWYPKYTPPGYNWKPKSQKGNVNPNLVEIVLFIVDSGCSKHMTGNLKLLTNFVEKFLGTVKFGNDQIAPILGYGDLVQGTITIKRVYYVEGLNHNLFSVGQFCDADLEVAFRKSTCYIRDLKGNDLLTGSRGTDLYSISLKDSTTPNPICLMAKATSSQAWLWHRRLSHLNFDTINLLSKNNIVNGLPKLKFVKDHLCSSCELGKAKRKSFHTKTTPSSKRRLQLLHMDLCGPMRVESINGKKYVLVIVDDYSRYTWTHFLRSKDETPGVLIDFLTLVQRGLHAQVTTV